MAIDLMSQMDEFVTGKKIAVLSDMLELGKDSIELHKEIGEYIGKNNSKKIDYLLTVGERSVDIHDSAMSNGFNKKNCLHFDNKKDLVAFLKTILTKEDDLILVKGSRGTRMEKVIYEIMEDKHLAKTLLVSDWKDSQ